MIPVEHFVSHSYESSNTPVRRALGQVCGTVFAAVEYAGAWSIRFNCHAH
jgi:hypothetical protein